ncbi:MAG: hypothetical protein ABI240_04820, partial [Sphingomonas sp.]
MKSTLSLAALLIGCAAPLAGWAQSAPDPLEQVRADARSQADKQATASDAPIIPDSQFEKAMPPIDPAMTEPLDPIEAIDAIPPAEPTTSATPTPVANAPASADPALTAPLPSLAGFDVEPLAATTAELADTIPDIRYSVKIEGLEKIGLEGQFRDLSALEHGNGKGANGAVIAARAREDEALALRLLHSEGYYDAVVSSRVEPVASQPGRATATISISPGGRYALGTIAVEGPDTAPPGLVRE